MIGKMESSPEKFFNDFFFVTSHQIPFSFYSLPCLGGLYGYSFLFVFSLYHLFLYLRECAHTIFQFFLFNLPSAYQRSLLRSLV